MSNAPQHDDEISIFKNNTTYFNLKKLFIKKLVYRFKVKNFVKLKYFTFFENREKIRNVKFLSKLVLYYSEKNFFNDVNFKYDRKKSNFLLEQI